MKMTLLAVISMLLVLGGCAKSATSTASQPATQAAAPALDMSGGLTEETLRGYVGKRIIVRGLWDGRGKMGGFVRGPEGSGGERIYILSRTEAGLQKENELYKASDGTPVEVTGVLHFYEPPPAGPSDPRVASTQPAPKHFYFDVEEAPVKFLRK